ncbi:MAG: PIN domain-containing protein [Candidatus Magnetoovum sp. WYHC-5]|nr:PIN domain-containing protein [Candidatus Magnetoovum sp. WYHC-5]
MRKIFVDTSAWLALNSKKDALHQRSFLLYNSLVKKDTFFITTNFILDETYTGLLKKIGHRSVVDFGERVQKSQILKIIHIDEEIEKEAWKLFKKYQDKFFSFTDCTSFMVMQELKITEVFTYDHHFEQMGFLVIQK